MQDNYNPFIESLGPLMSKEEFYSAVEKIYKSNLNIIPNTRKKIIYGKNDKLKKKELAKVKKSRFQ